MIIKINKMLSGLISLLLVLPLTACKNPFEKESVSPETETTTNVVNTQEHVTNVTTSSESLETEYTGVHESESEEFDESAGGNPDEYKIIEITVSSNQYFYNNHEITYDEFVEMLVEADAITTVIITDELASDGAFTKITQYLDEQKIPYSIS